MIAISKNLQKKSSFFKFKKILDKKAFFKEALKSQKII